MPRTKLQFIPARGRKRDWVAADFHAVLIAIYPREGTETLLLFSMVFPFLIAIYPREGTETEMGFAGSSHGCIAIYPREGTETMEQPGRSHQPCPLQFIPARGRKRQLVQFFRKHFRLQFIPARGRKRRVPPLPVVPILLQFIPARGRKLIHDHNQRVPEDCNLSPRGDGNGN